MRSTSILICVVLAAFLAGRAHAQSPKSAQVMTPGLWEITVQTRSPIVGPPISYTVCLDKAHVARPEPPKSRATDDCQVVPEAASANQTAYTIRCTNRKVSSTSRFTYAGDHFDGAVTINTPDGVVEQVHTGKRIGDCDDFQPDSVTGPAAKN